jgi:hypothetical protein
VECPEYGPHMDLSELPHPHATEHDAEEMHTDQPAPSHPPCRPPSREVPEQFRPMASTSMVRVAESEAGSLQPVMPFSGAVALASLLFAAISWGRRQAERDRHDSKVLQAIVDERRRKDLEAMTTSESGGLSAVDRAADARAKVRCILYSSHPPSSHCLRLFFVTLVDCCTHC